MTTEPNRPTHGRVADLLGVTQATVSRIRSGDRLPSIEIMQRIKKLLAWSLDAQVSHRDNGTYASEFNAKLASFAPLSEPRGE